jgi:hypothetical protein
VTEEQIAAVEIGELLPISKIGTTPILPLAKRYQVNGLPEWMTAIVHTPDRAHWFFTVRTNEERPGRFKYLPTRGDRPSSFRSRSRALDGLKQYLHDHFMD